MSKFKIKPFRRMICQLGNLLSHDDVMELALLTEQSPDISRKSVDSDKPFQHLMASLEEQEIVGENNVDALIELLDEIQAEEALELVQDYKMLLSDSTADTSSMAPQLTQGIQPPSGGSIETKRQENPAVSTQEPPRIARRCPNMGRTKCARNTNNTCEELIPILESIGIHGNKELTVSDSMTLDTIHLTESYLSKENVVMAFLSQLMSYDYRSVRLFKNLGQSLDNDVEANIDNKGHQIRISCRDITSAIIRHCDSFLRQDVLSKMSACQLAVPILFSEPDPSSVTFLLWALQKITKAWKDPVTTAVHEKSVVNYPFPVVTSLRLGNPDCSKSNVVNKILGSVQGNDDHPYFASREHESCPSVLSHGHLEGVWYLPSGGKTTKHTLNKAMCFLNLRGDATALTKQLWFICKYTTVVIIFVGKREVSKMVNQIDGICKKSKVIVVMCPRGKLSPRWKGDDHTADALRKQGAIVIDAFDQSVIDLCENICIQINVMLSHPSQAPVICLSDLPSFCNDININVDISNSDCSQARESVEAMLQECRANPNEYKSRALPLQLKWQKWSELDKDSGWKGAHGNVERELSKLHRAKEEQRRMQRQIGMSKEMRILYDELCNPSAVYKKFFIHWFQHNLNETSFTFLRPLADALKDTRDSLRESGAEITRLQRNLNGPALPEKERKSLQAKIKENKTKEMELRKKLNSETQKLDASSLGFEHFVREFGQVYECFHNVPCRYPRQFDVSLLPKMAAEMLLSGYPLEIFDGDTCHVPLKWVQGVLSAVRGIIGDVSVYVISVIGIQSSGKSTLLNSMFGVRFAVSAGRCTRGVFLQLLPIAENLKQLLDCDYVAVIDTEGLKAPQKAVAERKNEDNELATFTLCLSDMTLINIGGQTVGEDLSNILQISAHAFIRMKEAHLRSSCYLVQQFVADVTAQYRNQTSTQSILEKLDQAVLTAAVEEKKEGQYRQFSDCFNIVNIDTEGSVQYVPSLWRGSMCSPNHDYSETVMKLKSALLREIKGTVRLHRISEFENRISSVWEAVKQEDFVFNFRNTNEIARYSNFTQMFKRQQLQLTQEMMKWELNAKQIIRSTSAANIQSRQEALFQELDEKISSEMDKIRTYIDETLQTKEFESVRHHATYFYRDLELVEKNSRDTVRSMIRIETAIIKNADTKQTQLLPQLKANLKRQVLPVAEKLKSELPQSCADMSSDGITIQIEKHVRAVFEEEWGKQMKTITLSHPTSTKDEIKAKLESDITMCVMETLQHTGLSKEMKELMTKLFEHCNNSPKVQSVNDIPNAYCTIGDCTNEMSRLTDRFTRIVDQKCRSNKFRFSKEFLNSLIEPLKGVMSMYCTGCGDKTVLMLCLCSSTIQAAHINHKGNILNTLMTDKKLLSDLNRDDINTESEIREDVKQCLINTTPQQTSTGVLKSFAHLVGDRVFALFTNSADYLDENFQNQLQRGFRDIIAKRNTEKWYSPQVTKDFMNMAQNMLKRLQVKEKKYQHLLGEACSFYIREATRSEREALSETLQWTQVQKVMQVECAQMEAQVKMFAHCIQDALPSKVLDRLMNFTEDDIVKYASLSISHETRHILDERFVQQLPMLDADSCERVMLVVRQSLNIFLGRMQESGIYNTIIFRSTVTELLQELDKQRKVGKAAHVVCIAYLCSWILPICVDMQYAFERENSVQVSLETEKELLYEDFKALCGGTCLDHLAAKSMCSIIEEALKATLKNKICTVLFERLFKTNDIFCSRPRFLQAVLENLCEEEIFENYAGYIRHHSSFIQTWTLNFIVKECSESANNRIRIEDIVFHEVEELIRKTEESLDATLRCLLEVDGDSHSFDVWIQEFGEHFEDNLNVKLNEEKVSEMKMYAVVSNYSLFTNECKSIVNNSFRENLLDHAEMPSLSSLTSIKEWFESLPKKLHLLLSQSVQGCGAQCPFCKTLCDDTVKEHNIHVSNLHFPAGVGGMKSRTTRKLTCHTCVASVASERGYYTCGCGRDFCNHDPRPYKDYKKDYPGWEIHPIADYEATLYWKWVLTRFNVEFAGYYRCQMADIPWAAVTKEEALSSIRNINS